MYSYNICRVQLYHSSPVVSRTLNDMKIKKEIMFACIATTFEFTCAAKSTLIFENDVRYTCSLLILWAIARPGDSL